LRDFPRAFSERFPRIEQKLSILRPILQNLNSQKSLSSADLNGKLPLSGFLILNTRNRSIQCINVFSMKKFSHWHSLLYSHRANISPVCGSLAGFRCRLFLDATEFGPIDFFSRRILRYRATASLIVGSEQGPLMEVVNRPLVSTSITQAVWERTLSYHRFPGCSPPTSDVLAFDWEPILVAT
jgi:hypothetical protein